MSNAVSDTSSEERRPRLIVRNASLGDVAGIRSLCAKVYPEEIPYSVAEVHGQLQNFPEGQFVAVYEGSVVGYCATFRISGEVALAPHDWDEITGAGFASRHEPDGEWLYGMDVFIDPEMRRHRIGQRLYTQRKAVCTRLNLRGIITAGRMPGYARRRRQIGSIENYVEKVRNKEIRDQVLSFQLRNGFELIGVLKDYLPSDHQSFGYASHLVWHNTKYENAASAFAAVQSKPPAETVRVSLVQYQQRRVSSFEEFGKQVEYFVDVVADYKADFVVFPELFTLQLLSVENREVPSSEAIEALTKYTEPLKALLSDLAVRYNINIIGGSHPTAEDGDVLNICYVCLRDGSVHQQAKIHPTPNERYWWGIKGSDTLHTIMTDCGPIGVLICYDAEFPELARVLIGQGARLLFVPFCTDERQSYLRVRYCAQARAVENQCFVAMAGNVGNLPNVENMDIQYAQSCILTPCDFPFARDGIAAETTPNVEMVSFADLRLDDLMTARKSGTVQNLRDRRFDLYSVEWKRGKR